MYLKHHIQTHSYYTYSDILQETVDGVAIIKFKLSQFHEQMSIMYEEIQNE